MDFGVVGMDMGCLMGGPETGEGDTHSSHVSLPETNSGHDNGSGSFKQQRSWPCEHDWKISKMVKPDDMPSPRTMPLPQRLHPPPPPVPPLMRSNSLAPPRQGQMLSFASNSSDSAHYHRMPSPSPSAYARNAAYGAGSVNPNMHGHFAAVRGPFTPSQWIELEHQALIYKYLNANAPVPSNLLIPLRKALYPAYPYGSPNPLSWGPFHLGYVNNDPEPGRCRRTDGKKWRCSRDAVAEQKYCERHINRGRHRSRKPVEGQTGHGASGKENSKAVAPVTTSLISLSVRGASPQQFKSLETHAGAPTLGSADPSAYAFANRMQDQLGFSTMSTSCIKPQSNGLRFNIKKKDIPMEESSQSVFGFVSTDSLLNPSHGSSYIPKNFGGSFLDFTDQETQDQNRLRQFIDDWPKDQSSQSVVSWPDDFKSDWTQLSMSTPMASDFSSSSSPTQEKLRLSPLRLSREFEPTQMLGVNNDHSEPMGQQANWVPVSWGSSVGGPLGEVLTNTSSCVNSKNSPSSNTSPLSLLNKGWDGSQLESSPTGVLQKSTFCSLSNSSSGSSPRAENKKNRDGVSLYDEVLGSTLASPSLPSL